MTSKPIKHIPCPECGSSDANTLYDDGHTHCYSCGAHTHGSNSESSPEQAPRRSSLTAISPRAKSFKDLTDRGISAATAKKYGVGVATNKDGSIYQHTYPYYNQSGGHVGNKIRKVADKSFVVEGDINKASLFGMKEFPPNSARQITIVEGECDAMAAFEMFGSKYPVVSVKNGIDGAEKDVAACFDYLNSFEQIVICFDKDGAKKNIKTGEVRYPGQEAARKVAALFDPGRVRILELAEGKDPNDYLRAGKAKAFVNEWYNAPVYTPEGLVMAKNLLETVLEDPKYDAIPYPYERINKMTYGIRLSELVIITADTGVGKSSLLNEIEFSILKNEEAEKDQRGLGLLRLEETQRDACIGLMSLAANKPLHLPDVREQVSREEMTDLFNSTLNNDRVIIWDHFGSNEIDIVLERIRHMAALGAKYIILDHLSIIVSDQNGDERKQLDEITTKLKTMCMNLNISVVAVIHQNRQGQIRSTAAVEQLANIVMKLYRDKTDPNENRRNVTKIVIEKNRFCGRTGPCEWLFYEEQTGRLRSLNEEQIGAYEKGDDPMAVDDWKEIGNEVD